MSNLKRTSLYDNHINLGAKMVEFTGYEMPIQYEGIKAEHAAVREAAGIFDVSHMGEVLIEGEKATEFVQHIFTNDISNQNDNQVLYGLMCYENGTVVDDLLVYKYNNNKYYLVVNASNKDKDIAWLKENNSFDVTITDKSDISEIAIQGPKAEEILQNLTDYDLSKITFFTFQEILVDGKECIVSRTGYTGEDGFEVYSHDVVSIWEKFINLGAAPIGLGARDTLRFEATLPLYGNEISDKINPIEASLGMFVKLDTDFIGRDALREIKENRKLKSAGIELIDKGIPRHGYPVLNSDQEVIGEVTTGYMLDRSIALALIPVEYKLGDELYIQVRSRMLKAKIVSRKFMSKNYKN
ncbi:glycine cleavage system aminomethyltransferase GcvT [Mycoplasmatota bacterium WC44]